VNVYHITYAPAVKTVHLHFWGCNLSCRGCLRLKEIYDSHLEEARDVLFDRERKAAETPQGFLGLEEVIEVLEGLEVRTVIFMGAEPTIDPELPELTRVLHKEFGSHNILLTNGLILADLEHIDEVVLSIKAVTDSLHRHYTGKSNKKALENFVQYYQSGVKLRSESVFIPQYIDYPEIERIASFIAQVDKGIPYRIDAYIPTGDNPWRRPTSEEMEKAVGIARKHLDNVSCLTGNEKLKFEVLRVI